MSCAPFEDASPSSCRWTQLCSFRSSSYATYFTMIFMMDTYRLYWLKLYLLIILACEPSFWLRLVCWMDELDVNSGQYSILSLCKGRYRSWLFCCTELRMSHWVDVNVCTLCWDGPQTCFLMLLMGKTVFCNIFFRLIIMSINYVNVNDCQKHRFFRDLKLTWKLVVVQDQQSQIQKYLHWFKSKNCRSFLYKVNWWIYFWDFKAD